MNIGETESYKEEVKANAEEKGWQYEELSGHITILSQLMNGEWGEDVFLVLKPGQTITPSYDNNIITSKG